MSQYKKNSETLTRIDELFIDLVSSSERTPGRAFRQTLGGFNEYMPNRDRPARNLEEALDMCGAALNGNGSRGE